MQLFLFTKPSFFSDFSFFSGKMQILFEQYEALKSGISKKFNNSAI